MCTGKFQFRKPGAVEQNQRTEKFGRPPPVFFRTSILPYDQQGAQETSKRETAEIQGGFCFEGTAHHCGVDHGLSLCSAPRQGAARRAAGLVQSPAAARRATALDDGRTYPAGRPRPPQWTFSPLCAPPCPHIGTGHKKPTEAGQCQSASRVDSDLNCAACRGLERRP